MSDLREEIATIANETNAISQRIEKADLQSILDRLERAVESVSKAWCGSWLGYHSRIYYEDFKPVPAGARFDNMSGFQDRYSNETRGEWVEYRFDAVFEILKKCVADADYDALIEEATKVDDEIREIRENLLSILESAAIEKDDPYLKRLVDDVKNIASISSTKFIEYLRPKGQFMSNDLAAIQGGVQTPPHIAMLAIIKNIQSIFDAIENLVKLARRTERHLNNKSRISKLGKPGGSIFIGHGRSMTWRDLKDFFQDRLNLPWDEFNRVPVAGVTNIARLSEMLNEAAIAFLVMTAEDEQLDGKMHARMNVIHEAGLFQGRLGFSRAIVILEQGCEEFSNIQGLGQIRFPSGNIKACFEEIRPVLEREGLLET